MASRYPLVSELPSLAAILVAGTFAFRQGAPGLRHDWLWPNDRHVLIRWFVESGLSVWNPHGLGGAGQVATFNLVLAYFAGLAAVGLSPPVVLFFSFLSLFLGSVFGIAKLFDELGLALDRIVIRMLGLIYALSPIFFQKAVAGQLFWLFAYAGLPWFAAFVWRGCHIKRDSLRSFLCAALLFALSSTQIQFLAFDVIVLLAILFPHARSARAWVGFAIVISIGMLHNSNVLLASFGPPESFNIASFHGTRGWEVDMSAPLLDLAFLSGYAGYDRLALPPLLLPLYQLSKYALVLLAIGGLFQRPREGPLVFAAIGLVALLFASGWYGPFAAVFDFTLQHSILFTVFRELFHVMALYALVVVVLAGYACARIPRRFAVPVLIVPMFVLLPFVSGGLDRLVPAVTPVAWETEAGYGRPHFRAPLPLQEPITKPGLVSGGNDPARLDDDVPTTGNAPLFVQWLFDPRLPAVEQRAVLADLGVSGAGWRDDRASSLPEGFEPGVGATFEGFRLRQRALRVRFAVPIAMSMARSTVMLERRVDRNSLQYALADRYIPPGRDVPFLSSFVGNDIRKQWVSLRLWGWFAPELTNLAFSDPVLTESGTPFSIAPEAAPGDAIYVLVAGRDCRLDGRTGTPVPQSRNGPYRWLRWNVARTIHIASLRVDGLASVARVRISRDAHWSPPAPLPALAANSTAVATSQKWPWSMSGSISETIHSETLVFGRTFSPGWHLILEGKDQGSARRVDGIFNGWSITRSSTPRTFTLTFLPQVRAGIVVGVSTCIEAAILGFVLWPKFRRIAV